MAATSIVLRLARPADAPAVAAMSRDLIEAGLGWRYRSARIARLVAAPETTVLVAAAGERIAGFAIMEFGAERAHLMLFAVDPRQQRQGIGRRMIEWLLKSAQTAGMASVHLELRAANAGARAFYRSVGFDATLQVPDYYDGREPALRMVRVLRPPGRPPPAWSPPA